MVAVRALLVAAIATVAAASVSIPQTRALTVALAPGDRRCFNAFAGHHQDKVFFSYQLRQGPRDFDVEVLHPDGETAFLAQSHEHDDEGKIFLLARSTGEYTFCVDNTGHSHTEKLISLNVAVQSRADTRKADAFLTTLRKMQVNALDLLEDQMYLWMRERAHRDTLESSNLRVVIRGVVELTAMVAMSVGQVYYLRHIFNKRQTRPSA